MLRQLPPTAVPINLSDLRSGLGPPPQVQAGFERALTQYLGVPTCKLAASGRTALYLLLHGLRQASDDPERVEVIIPAYTCPALAKVTLDAELRPRFVDISPHTMAFQGDRLEAEVSRRTLAVILVHPFGIPQRAEQVQTLAHAAGAVVIEDAAQAMGAQLGRQPAGTLGDFGLFSLGPGKPISTGGGGIVCTRDEGYGPTLEGAWQDLPRPSAATSGWTLIRLALFTLAFHPAAWWLATRLGLHRVGEHEASWGYNIRGLSDAQAGVGLRLLERLDAINRGRSDNAHRLIDSLKELEYLHIPSPTETAEPIYLRLPVLVDDEERRERLFRRLWNAGIGVGRMYQHPLPHHFPQMADGEAFPGADHVARHLLTLPTHHYLADTDVAQIVDIFQAERSTP
jgi:dTDP-4-amino-4,6-dideoxygalactose transaminase